MSYENLHRGGGGTLPVFRGTRTQRGYGLGSMLKGMLRSAIPFLKEGGKVLGKKALQTGIYVARHVLNGENVKRATSANLKRLARNFEPGVRKSKNKRRRPKKEGNSVRKAKRRKTSDIFD